MTTANYARLPQAPKNASPVPHLTSLYHFDNPGDFGSRKYPGNCGGGLIKDLLTYFKPNSVFDPMTGSGTCRDVCDRLTAALADIGHGLEAARQRNLDDGKDSFQKFTHLGQATDNQRLSSFGLSVH